MKTPTVRGNLGDFRQNRAIKGQDSIVILQEKEKHKKEKKKEWFCAVPPFRVPNYADVHHSKRIQFRDRIYSRVPTVSTRSENRASLLCLVLCSDTEQGSQSSKS
jgi:hypothetical protein